MPLSTQPELWAAAALGTLASLPPMRYFSDYGPPEGSTQVPHLGSFHPVLDHIHPLDGKAVGSAGPHVSSSTLYPECLHLWAETHLAAGPPLLHKNLRIAGKCRKFQLSLVTTNKAGNNSSVDSCQTAPTEK